MPLINDKSHSSFPPDQQVRAFLDIFFQRYLVEGMLRALWNFSPIRYTASAQVRAKSPLGKMLLPTCSARNSPSCPARFSTP